MMPPAMLPAMPKALTSCLSESRSAAPMPATAPITPKIAVGWKPALCTCMGATLHRRHMTSEPTATPRKKSGPDNLCRSAVASNAGMMTTPACTGPPS